MYIALAKSIISKFAMDVRYVTAIMLLGCLTFSPAHAASPQQVVLVALQADGWRYFDGCCAAPDNWKHVNFDDSRWPAGQALLGYGDADVRTELSFGSNAQRKTSAAYFRRRFKFDPASTIRLIAGRLRCDDGAVVYINNREVYRRNMPAGPITADTLALHAVGPARERERAFHEFEFPADQLVEGENVIAVSVHQANPTSSDLALDLELLGYRSREASKETSASSRPANRRASVREVQIARFGVD